MRYRSEIVKGHGRGKLLGFPTFNLVIPTDFNYQHGIYAAWAWINDTRYQAAMHFGPVPTFAESDSTLELFLLNYTDEVVVKSIEVEPVKYLREILAFPNSQSLAEQIGEDVVRTKELLEGV